MIKIKVSNAIPCYNFLEFLMFSYLCFILEVRAVYMFCECFMQLCPNTFPNQEKRDTIKCLSPLEQNSYRAVTEKLTRHMYGKRAPSYECITDIQ